MRILSLSILLCLSQAQAQSPIEEGRVLKALPLDFDKSPEHPAAAAPQPAPATQPAPIPIPAPEPTLSPAPSPHPAAVEVFPIDQKPTGDDAVRLQIFLDHENFGPGVIDGKIGHFSELAVKSWNELHGHPLDSWTAVNIAARKAVPNPFAVAIVP